MEAVEEVEMISVCFKQGGRQFYYDAQGENYKVGEPLIVETARGNEFAVCYRSNFKMEEEKAESPLRCIVRRATEKDCSVIEKNKSREAWARKVALEKIKQHELEMKLVSVEYSFEGNKVLFYFTSDGRVDFRGLVRDLAATIHARIELRQIGVRDESRMLGGLGICGRPFCCNLFLDKFQPVSIKMAKTQNLSLNPSKISGSCGRLMCCLKYEQEAYEDLHKTTPRSDSFVETPDGVGTINAVNLLRQQVTVRLESDPTVANKYYNSEIVVVRNGRGKRPEGSAAPPQAELEKRRRHVEEPQSRPMTSSNPLAASLESILNPPTQTSRNEKSKKQEQRTHQNRGSGTKNTRGKKSGKDNRPPQKRKSSQSKLARPNNNQGSSRTGKKKAPIDPREK